eukprot:m.197063 g.197063  ORF g.197063 m.197063 type:complete len:85 (+) comp19982_c0_seq1:1715-1969(+)
MLPRTVLLAGGGGGGSKGTHAGMMQCGLATYQPAYAVVTPHALPQKPHDGPADTMCACLNSTNRSRLELRHLWRRPPTTTQQQQ